MALSAFEHVSVVDGGQDFSTYGSRLRGCDFGDLAQVFENHYKFIAGQAGDGVYFADAAGDSVGGFLQQKVPDVVAQRVVHRLEAIEVYE
jgi:hypothetical protein